MPNIQFSMTDDEFVELVNRGRFFGLSSGRMSKLILKAYLEGRETTQVELLKLMSEVYGKTVRDDIPSLFGD